MWSRRQPCLPPPAKVLFCVVLSVLKFGILTVKHFEIFGLVKIISSLRGDSHKASDWKYRNRTSLYMVSFGASPFIMHHNISYVLVHRYIIMHHYIACVLVHHYIIMHHYISCVFVHHYISCITIYHKSIYIMHHYISCSLVQRYIIMHYFLWCVLVHHYIIIRHYIPCVYWCITIYQASLYMMRFGMVGQKLIFASLLREIVFGAGVEFLKRKPYT